jgi:predicted exporter
VAGYRARALVAAALGAGGIVAMTVSGLRPARRALTLMVPVTCALVLTIAALLALGQRLTLFHLVSLLFVVGVGINYAVFFDFRSANPKASDLALLSIVVAGVASLIASGALAAATTPALAAIGATTGFGAVFSFTACATLARRRPP